MSDSEIRTGIDRIIEQLQAEMTLLRNEAIRFEGLADLYSEQLVALTRERDALLTRLNALEAMACANPACQVCQIGVDG